MKTLKNLLCIIPYPLFPTTSAGRKSILHFNNHLAKKIQPHAVGVIYPEKPKVGFDLIELFKPSKLRYANIFYAFGIKKIITDKQAEFLLIEHPYMAWMGVVLKRLTGIKWGIRSHNIEYERFRDFGKFWWPILKKYELWLYRKADAVFFITESDRDTILRDNKVKHSFVMPTGMLIGAIPPDREASRQYLQQTHNIQPDEKILLYNGALDYKPNREALDAILKEVNPLLEANQDFRYKLIICGAGLDESYNKLEAYKGHNVIYCGFVDDITTYFKGADLYLNAVIGGGGIKTRLVEAIAYNTNVVSTVNGSIGFYGKTVEEKVMIVPDHDWQAFTDAIVTMCNKAHIDTTQAFYDYYYWDNIAARFIEQVNTVIA